MDVFHVGASAPKAPESKSIERSVSEAKGRTRPLPLPSDEFASSSDAKAVADRVAKLSATPEVREELLRSVGELLGNGLLDTLSAARRAAGGILDA